MTLGLAALAVVACGLGALARHHINQRGQHARWPWPTVAANIMGAGVLGAVAAAVLTTSASTSWLLVLGGGFAGGLSTVSTFAVDALVLWREGRRQAALTYVALTVLTSFGAAALGWAVVAS